MWALQQVERATEKQSVTNIDYSLPLHLLIFNTTHTPTGSFEVNCLSLWNLSHRSYWRWYGTNTILAQKNPIYIGHIRAHSDLPGSLAPGNDCIDKALIGEALVSDPIVWLNVLMIKFIFLVIT